MPYSDALTDEEIDALVGVYAVRAEIAGKRAVLAERECARLAARLAELEATLSEPDDLAAAAYRRREP